MKSMIAIVIQKRIAQSRRALCALAYETLIKSVVLGRIKDGNRKILETANGCVHRVHESVQKKLYEEV